MKYLALFLVGFGLAVNSQLGTPKSSDIIRQLKIEKDHKKRAELILKIGDFAVHDLSPVENKHLVSLLLKWYRNDPSPYVHAAIDRLFRHPSVGEIPRKKDWNLEPTLQKIDQELVKKRQGTKQWFLTAELHTMSVITGPVTFLMGSPSNEHYRTEDELQHTVSIPRSFAINTKEVTVAQFQRFLEENPLIKQAAQAANQDQQKNPSIENKRLLLYSPEGDCPQVFVTWYEAAQYCNWLSQRDGIPKQEWCYPSKGILENGMIIQADYLKRKGYRLPTEAEWEYAARAGSTTSRFYGESDELLSQYAWYSKNPPQRKNDPNDPNDPRHTYPGGQLLPNKFGLFDVYGNVWEWCDARRRTYVEGNYVDESLEELLITDSIPMIRRGGSYSYAKDVMRSAHRGATQYLPNQRRDNVGFRIARTI